MKRMGLYAFLAAFTSVAWAAPATYVLEGDHSFAHFSYVHVGFSKQTSRFDKTSGTITYDAAAKKAAVEVTIDMKSVSTGVAALNEHLQAADFFDVAKYPTATFKSTAVKFEGDRPASIEGNLTIKGITKPVTFTVTRFRQGPHPMSGKPAIGANATAKIKRTEFNAGQYAPMTSDEVELEVVVEAVQK